MAKDKIALQSNRSSSPLPSFFHILLILVLGAALLLLTACGPEKSATDDEALLAETQRIAQEFVASGNLEQARSQLSALDVANANLWLILTTENAIAQNPESATPLVQLSESLGLESAQIERFAIDNNLLEGLVALAGDAAAVALVAPAEVAVAPQATSETNSQTGSATDGEPEVKVLDESTADDATSADEANGDADSGDADSGDADSGDTETEGAETTTPEAADTEEATGAAVELPTPTPAPDAAAKATLIMNVRNGPGITYAIVGSLDDGEEAEIVGKNEAGDWWEVELADGQTGWVYGLLVETSGDVGAITVAANIPPPPVPTAAPQPVAEAPAPPAEETPAEEEPAAEAPAVDPNAGPHFTMISKRMWGKQENDGCVGKHLLRIHVIDANGVRLNGVRLQGIYVGEILVTGSQGKGDGIIEYDLHNSGEGFKVIQDLDGRDATSDNAEGFTTRSVDIPKETLIETGYCSDSADCDAFYASWGCQGHHSWEATFQRNY